MMKTLLLSTVLVAGSTTVGLAQSFTGAELGIEFRDVLDGEDFGSVTYFGSAEFDAFYGVSIGLDATSYDFDIGPSGIGNLTAHIFYNLNPSTDVGLFIGSDFADGDNSGVFGAEVAYDYGSGVAEGYLGSAEDGIGRDISIFGAGATYNLGPSFALGGNFDGYRGDDFSASAIEVGGFYTMDQGPKFGATIGQIGIDEDGSNTDETTFGIQASIALGPNGGTTFGRRGAYEAIKASPLSD